MKYIRANKRNILNWYFPLLPTFSISSKYVRGRPLSIFDGILEVEIYEGNWLMI
jgi:hypothetical protein